MKILFFEIEEWECEMCEDLKANHEVTYSHEALSMANVAQYKDAQIISTFIYSELNEEILSQFEDLKLIATRSTGYDHIDTDFCSQHGIIVSNVPTYGDNTVAEHVFGLLLMISHKLVDAVDRTRRGDFSLKGLKGFDLKGKTLGVIGTGSIGQCVIKIAHGFGMEIIAYDIKPDKEMASSLGFAYVFMDELLSHADVITLHVPYNKGTHHLISDDEFAKMKKDVVFINTARGNIVDTRALMNAIADEKVRAVGLDVLPNEPLIREEAELIRSIYQKEHDLETLLADHVLLRLRNVFITPHSAFYTREAIGRILKTTAENIRSFIAGKPQNTVG